MTSDACIASAASRRCRLRWQYAALLGLLFGGLGCATGPVHEGVRVMTAPAPSDAERYCAWYGDSDGQTLYAGLAPFWSAMRAHGDDPQADLERAGPQWVGRFDLVWERWNDPIALGGDAPRSGVWDVHHTDHGVYFTTFYETSGRVDPGGDVVRFEEAGTGLNELAPGPDGRVLVSRYGGEGGRKSGGELLTLDPDGRVVRRWPMPAPIGFFAAPKTPAWNPARERLVATSDLLPEFDGEPRHDAYQLTLDGDAAQWELAADPELQFVATHEGTEYRVEAHQDGKLWLRRIRPPGSEPHDQRVLLDPDFPAATDFAQDLKVTADGRLVVTRWSGAIHVVNPDGSVDRVQLPRLERGGLYYTGVIHGSRLCATHCGGVTVVCTDAP